MLHHNMDLQNVFIISTRPKDIQIDDKKIIDILFYKYYLQLIYYHSFQYSYSISYSLEFSTMWI